MASKNINVDFALIKKLADKHTDAMISFLRDIVAIPSFSAGEKAVALRS